MWVAGFGGGMGGGGRDWRQVVWPAVLIGRLGSVTVSCENRQEDFDRDQDSGEVGLALQCNLITIPPQLFQDSNKLRKSCL